MYKYVLNSVVKISMMFARYFEYYTPLYLGGRFFVDTQIATIKTTRYSIVENPCKFILTSEKDFKNGFKS